MDVGAPCSDSRLIRRGDVFFAIDGTQLKGTDYMADAAKGGASAIVCAEDVELELSIPVIHVRQVRRALAHAAAEFYDHPSRSFYLNGVTGTNGKTTITYLLEKFWEKKTSGVIGTVNIRYAGKIQQASHTTPDPVGLQSIFADMKTSQVQKASVEVSSHALDQYRCDFCDFDSAIFTNLTQDHLDYHGTMENYFQAKSILFERILRDSAKKNTLAVINQDDDYGKKLLTTLRRDDLKAQGFSLKDTNADLHVLRSSVSMNGLEAELGGLLGNFILRSNLIGDHNLRNIMAALLVGAHSGESVHDMLEKLESITVPGRLDRVGKTRFFVDYAHTPDALLNVLTAVRNVMSADGHSGRLITVFGCGGDRDRTKRPLMGEVAAQLSDVVLVTSDNPRTENPEKIVADILPGVTKRQKPYDIGSGYIVEVDRREALRRAVELAGVDDVVVVAGKGHEDYQIIGKEKIHFDDKEILAGLLG